METPVREPKGVRRKMEVPPSVARPCTPQVVEGERKKRKTMASTDEVTVEVLCPPETPKKQIRRRPDPSELVCPGAPTRKSFVRHRPVYFGFVLDSDSEDEDEDSTESLWDSELAALPIARRLFV